ncbi:MAG: addiction module protein [Phycisphaeraceae bacterium]|nr:addiction module protein [Phycisphaeraceae bacterium]
MSISMKELGLEQLSPAERILLAEELWDSLTVCPENVPVTDAQREDLQRRLDAYRDDPKAGSTWEDVKSRLRGRGEG